MTFPYDPLAPEDEPVYRTERPRCGSCGALLEEPDLPCLNCLPPMPRLEPAEREQHIHRLLTPEQSDEPQLLILASAHGSDWTDWAQCGVVAPPDTPCTAWSEAAKNQCPKRAAVMIDVGYVPLHVALCGGHLDVHRRRDMRVEWT